jgi:hypothetical protein
MVVFPHPAGLFGLPFPRSPLPHDKGRHPAPEPPLSDGPGARGRPACASMPPASLWLFGERLGPEAWLWWVPVPPGP